MRQRELIVRLESDNHTAMSAEARGMLKTMEKLLSHMTADHAAAEERLSEVSVDEQSLEKVERDCPMSFRSKRNSHRLRPFLSVLLPPGIGAASSRGAQRVVNRSAPGHNREI